MPDQEKIEISQLNGEEVRGRVALLKTLKDHFWIQWRNEYLLELRNSHQVKMKDAEGQTVTVGDTVIVHEDGQHRELWKLRRVESLIKGKDGLARGAVVKSITPKMRRPTLLRRPLQKLYPLELGNRSQEDLTVDVPDLPAGTENAEVWPRQEVACRADVPDLPAETENAEVWPRQEAACRADNPDLPAGTVNADARPRQEAACRADRER